MHGKRAFAVQRVEEVAAQFQGCVHQGRQGRGRAGFGAFARDNLHVVLAETVEPQPGARFVEFAVRPHPLVAVKRGPFGDVGVKAFAVAHHRGQQRQGAAARRLGAELARQFIPRLGFDGKLAIRTELGAEPGEE